MLLSNFGFLTDAAYLPTISHATDFIHAQLRFYPDRGYDAAIYCGK